MVVPFFKITNKRQQLRELTRLEVACSTNEEMKVKGHMNMLKNYSSRQNKKGHEEQHKKANMQINKSRTLPQEDIIDASEEL